MNWSIWVLIGASINVLNNWGYKTIAGKDAMFLMAGCVMGIASLVTLGYALGIRGEKFATLAQGNMPWVIAGMGIASPLIMVCMLSAFQKGPLTLVDPLWACTYAIVSACIGMLILREQPGAAALAGIGLYLAGAFLMARG